MKIYTDTFIDKKFIYILGALNILLIIFGGILVPSAFTSRDGITSLSAAIAMQIAYKAKPKKIYSKFA